MSIKLNNVDDLVAGVMRHGPDILNYAVTDPQIIESYIQRIFTERLDYPVPTDSINSKNWFIPTDYKTLDIEKFLHEQCPEENRQRLIKEIALFKEHNMFEVLNVMKYIVDTLRKNKIVWGVGRGSSVASYALYLIGVHKIDSIKYSIPIEEFFKGEQNG